MDISNKNAINVNTEMMPFKKFVEMKKIYGNYHDETIKINGTFRDKKTKKIVKNDIFTAHKVGHSIFTTYKAYLDWFNWTKSDFDNEREFVSVKLV